MQVDELLERLGYADSPHFLQGDALAHAGDHGHAFRKAQKQCALRGAYTLRPASPAQDTGLVPLVYVCEAQSSQEAARIHQLVWNQNIVPFLVVLTPRDIRLYPGFRYVPATGRNAERLTRVAADFNLAMSMLQDFTATAIDQGLLWQTWGNEVTPDTRVDRKLLDNLESLGEWLRRAGMSKRDANALIGKYVYLRYLRDRHILSDRKLAAWNIDADKVFGRHATLKAFYQLADHLHEWLNGSVFPLPDSLRGRLTREQLQYVAGAFAGDEPDGQLHLDFQAYDFSFIPIETLSVIYEQFLHAQGQPGDDPDGDRAGQPTAEERGAYYTPIPLVNFMIDQMELKKPLAPGMRVLDPACGSGAFLVQCYRRLIERALRDKQGKRLRPTELRDLLTSSIFGVDSDSDACQVAELSLILTLLDYIDQPDLGHTSFKLPVLRDSNLHCCDAFDLDSPWATSAAAHGYDWIIGNPPWREFKNKTIADTHPHLAAWLDTRAGSAPIGDNQIAEAFAWRACELVADRGAVGFLMPAMTLFKHASRGFRAALFGRTRLFCVANFANLAEVLFAGRSRVPAAALFYLVPHGAAAEIADPQGNNDGDDRDDSSVLAYAPFVANQEANRPTRTSRRIRTWSIVVNASEVRELPYRDIADGDSMPWKLAMWGSAMDQRLLRAVDRRFPSLGALEDAGRLVLAEGPQLRSRSGAREALEHHPELAGQPRLSMPALERLRDFFAFPAHAIEPVPAAESYVRAGRYRLPLQVCQPPHVIVSAARTFAIFTDDFLLVPPRQIGIAAAPEEREFLKALSLYLSSDFTRYHQLLHSTQLGIKRPVATLQTLRQLPVAIAESTDLSAWTDLHARLVRATHAAFAASERIGDLFDAAAGRAPALPALVDELNELVSDALQLDRRGRALIHDLVRVKMALDDGKLGTEAVRPPSKAEILAYAEMLRTDLDSFVAGQDAEGDVGHNITVMADGRSGMVEVELVWADTLSKRVELVQASERAARELHEIRARLLERRAQWIYFHRNLRVYEGERVYLFKPMQHLHWTRSQALLDAGEIIAETIVGERQ